MKYQLSRLLALLALTLLAACGGGQPRAQQPTARADAAGTAAPTAEATSLPARTAAPAPQAAPPAERPATDAPTSAPATPTLAAGAFVNPVIDRDFPDPDTLTVGETYYAYATNTGSTNVQAARSQDLVHWEILPDALPALPSWAEAGNTWAPEVSAAADNVTYLLYFVARVANTGRQCIGVATSQAPEGPFASPAGAPLVCQADQGGSIDPSLFVDDDGSRYLLWKNDGNCCGGQTWIYIQQLSGDGQTLEGEPTKLITADQAWEGVLVEAPTLWKRDGRYYLFYSANDYASQRYAVGYAVADQVLGPYAKPARRALLKSVIPEGVLGPGGQDIVTDGDGETWLVYHSWTAGSYRRMNIDRLVWEDGVPAVQPHGRTPQPAP